MNARIVRKAVIATLSTSLVMAMAATTGCDTPQANSVAPEAARALFLFEDVAFGTISIDDATEDDFDIDRPTE